MNKELLVEYKGFQLSDEMGWMEVTMEEIADEEGLDLKYRSDFNIAFDKAIDILKQKQPQLNFELIYKFKENMF
jgi:hypothetical protein